MQTASQEGPKRPSPFVRLDYLDALRGYAALYVLLFHVAWLPEDRLALPAWMSDYVLNGSTGVDLFFVLSAFALSYSLDARHGERHLIRHFYIRRFFRIAPLFYVMMAFYYAKDLWQTGTWHSGSEVLINASLLFNLFPSHILGYVWASWTIGVEVLFYLVFPLIFSRVRGVGGTAALFLITALGANAWSFLLDHYGVASGYLTPDQLETVRHHSFLSALPVFVSGMLAYRLHSGYLARLGAPSRRRLGSLLILLFAALYWALLDERLHGLLWDEQVWLGPIYACLVLGLALRPAKLLVNGITVRLGKVSYSLYLLHPSLVVFLAPAYHLLYTWIPSTTGAFLAAFAVTALMLTAASALSYKAIERAGMRLGERVIARGSRPSLLATP
ncbi:acyltransferase family protein [Thiorhodococcus minor]|uniref:Acyltransferase n=1 Tax=Thiorhodococcus minor TaxID=57489 RepID=A0A6M0JZS7_9GAMM|nr:acyltransferase [Thiorhodococcus minor]NEV61585.1 acyltransferase [Thiorhodococcus minor]